MWPVLLNMTREDCRRTLRRLELEAYSNMISVFRAQGALEDSRKKLLEELRTVLRISNDRHSAEARRVANDELLATIAEQLSGPNTNIGWICEGRRRIPLMPRGIPQSAYTEIADKVAEALAAENKELLKKIQAEKLVSLKSNEEDMLIEGETAEESLRDSIDDTTYPPIAMEDPTSKLWETELLSRKRKVPEGGAVPDEPTTPAKSIRNIPVGSNQKHLNLSQIYSKFSQPTISKSTSQSKHSYNQVSKVSTPGSSHGTPKTGQAKPRAPKQPKQQTPLKTQAKKNQEIIVSPSKYNTPMQIDYSAPPNTFLASYTQSLLGHKSKDYDESRSMEVTTYPAVPAPAPHELTSTSTHEDAALHTTPHKQTVSGKACQLVIKKKTEIGPDRKATEMKLLQKPVEGVKLFSNRQVLVTPGSTQKTVNAAGKVITTKVIGPITKAVPNTQVISDKMVVMSKPNIDIKNVGNKIVMSSSVAATSSPAMVASPKITEPITPRGIPATDLKVSAKTFLLNPKPGQKMVVVPSKARTKPGPDGQQMPLIHLKSMPPNMRLLPMSGQSMTPIKSTATTILHTPQNSVGQSLTPTTKVVSVEPIKTANMADIVPVKGLTPVITPKVANPILRPSSAKGNVIVVQKGNTIGKPLAFAKNGNDMSKIIMGKNITQLMQASKRDKEVSKAAGNIILLDLNNDRAARATTMSEILDSRSTPPAQPKQRKDSHKITQDTPVLFDTQITDETCNASSLDSTVSESIGEMVSLDSIQSMPIIEKQAAKDPEGTKDTSSTDWEIELENVTRKDKDDDKLNSLHLDLGMSSDSESDFIDSRKKAKLSPPDSIPRTTPSAESRETYESSSGMSNAARILLSQFQDEGSSSNDSSFALKAKSDKLKDDSKLETDALSKAKEKLTEKIARSQLKRIDVYSTAISSSEINLDSFSYLDEGMMAGDEDFPQPRDDTASIDSQTVSEPSPSNK